MAIRILICAVLLCAGTACGDHEAPRASRAGAEPGRVAGATPGAAEALAADPTAPMAIPIANDAAPRILSLSLSPDPPESGRPLRAVVRVESGVPGGYDLAYHWDVAGERVEGQRGAITLPKLGKGSRIGVRVVASNEAGESDPVSAQVEIPNTPPQLRDLRLEEESQQGGAEHWVANAWAHDPDGDEIAYHYTWILNDAPTDVQGPAFPTALLGRGDRLRVRVAADDGEERSRSVESGVIEVANTSPEILSTPPGLGPSGVFRYAVEAEDADGDRALLYELVAGPRGMEMDARTGELLWKPETDQAGRHRVEIAVDDRRGGRATQEFVLPIVVNEEWEEETLPAAAADY